MIRVSEEVAEQLTGRYRRISATKDVLDEDIKNMVKQRRKHRMLGKCLFQEIKFFFFDKMFKSEKNSHKFNERIF